MRILLCLWALCALAPPGVAAPPTAYDCVVAQDGSGDFLTVSKAIKKIGRFKPGHRVIYIRAGVYREKIVEPTNGVTLVGEDAARTVLTYDDYQSLPGPDGEPLGTDESATFHVYGDDFTAYNLTFENTAASQLQGVAAWVQGDRGRFFGCRFLGYQDTLLASRNKQYFKNCYIEGAVDFIFGGATAVFDRCEIHCTGYGFVTAASTSERKQYGLVFKGCTISGPASAGSVYLGRPWTPGANVVYLDCELSHVINPAGWDNWANPELESTVYNAEHASSGEGARPANRARWSHQISDDDAAAYTLKRIFNIPVGAGAKAGALWYKDS